jgi:hypothetical protein
MNITDLLNHRVLVAEKTGSFIDTSKVVEFTIIEIAPSGNFIKLRDMNGRRYWKAKVDVKIIEALENIEVNPDQKTKKK